MKLIVLMLVSTSILFSEDKPAEYPMSDPLFQNTYQDILVHNKVQHTGSDICDVRYELLKPILNTYKEPFTVLDIGAAEGFFSFKIAEEFPQARVFALEGGSIQYGYKSGPDRLKILCSLNAHLKNVSYLHHLATLQSLQNLQKNEHFDVVLAFLVIHIIAEQSINTQKDYMKKARQITNEILNLGDDVIIEASFPDTYPQLASDLEKLCQQSGGVVLGQVQRVKNNNNGRLGKLFWFKNPRKNHLKGIHLDTFRRFGGEWPNQVEIKTLRAPFPQYSDKDLILLGSKIELLQHTTNE